MKKLKFERNETKKQQSSGITLIALVITIIVLLILAGISISMLSGDNSILQRATDAKERTSITQEEEAAKLSFTTVQMDLTQGKKVDITAFQSIVDGYFGSGNATGTIGGNSFIISVKKTGNNYKMDDNGNITQLSELSIDFAPGVLELIGNTYTINSIEDLVAFSYNVNSGAESYEGKTVILGRNLDFQDDMSYVDANSKYKKDDNGYLPDSTATRTIKDLMTNKEDIGFIPIGKDVNNTFKGIFDGTKKSLTNLYINSSSFCGLFGYTNTEIKIYNISLTSCNIKGNGITAGLIAIAGKKIATIENINISGKVESTGSNAGGIIGFTEVGLRATNCSNYSDVKASADVGGIAHGGNFSQDTVILNCHNTGNIESINSIAGGIVAQNAKQIINCYNTGDVVARNSNAAGIIASGTSSIVINCYNEGKIESGYRSSGIVADGANSIINCYNNGEILGVNSPAGGINASSSAEITNCYNLKSVTSSSEVVGGIAPSGTINNCYNSGIITTGVNSPAGGIASYGSTITNSHNSGDIVGVDLSKLGEIVGDGNTDNTNNYLIKTTNATNVSNAVGKSQSEMDEIMSIQNFVILMNSYVTANNADSSKIKLKAWKVENGLPVFAE